jgi:hypothetical protein
MSRMTTQQFATLSVRVLGLAAITIGIVLLGSSSVMGAVGGGSLTGTSMSNLHLHDAYYIVSHVEQAWLAPGAISLLVGIALLLGSGKLGKLLVLGVGTES